MCNTVGAGMWFVIEYNCLHQYTAFLEVHLGNLRQYLNHVLRDPSYTVDSVKQMRVIVFILLKNCRPCYV